jgi:hypothetical protein
LARKRWGSDVGSPRVRFEAVRRSEDASAIAGGGGAAVRPPRPNFRQPDGSASQGRCMGDPLGCTRKSRRGGGSTGRGRKGVWWRWQFGPFLGCGARPTVGWKVHGTWVHSDGRRADDMWVEQDGCARESAAMSAPAVTPQVFIKYKYLI